MGKRSVGGLGAGRALCTEEHEPKSSDTIELQKKREYKAQKMTT